jgi:hypothetical protein
VTFVHSQDGNVLPHGGVPVGIVISLLGAFKSVSVTIVVLSGEDGGLSSLVQTSLLFSVRDPETHVSLSGLASLVRVVGLVHSELEVAVGIGLGGGGGVVGDGGGCGTISNSVESILLIGGASVLDNHVATQFGVQSATVLVGPFNVYKGASIVAHCRSNTITSFGIVL